MCCRGFHRRMLASLDAKLRPALDFLREFRVQISTQVQSSATLFQRRSVLFVERPFFLVRFLCKVPLSACSDGPRCHGNCQASPYPLSTENAYDKDARALLRPVHLQFCAVVSRTGGPVTKGGHSCATPTVASYPRLRPDRFCFSSLLVLARPKSAPALARLRRRLVPPERLEHDDVQSFLSLAPTAACFVAGAVFVVQ